MDYYIILENTRLKILNNQIFTNESVSNFLSNMSTYIVEVSVKQEDYSEIIKLKNVKNVPFVIKRKNDFFTGQFDMNSISEYQSSSIRLEVNNVSYNKCEKEIRRDLILKELLNPNQNQLLN